MLKFNIPVCVLLFLCAARGAFRRQAPHGGTNEILCNETEQGYSPAEILKACGHARESEQFLHKAAAGANSADLAWGIGAESLLGHITLFSLRRSCGRWLRRCT